MDKKLNIVTWKWEPVESKKYLNKKSRAYSANHVNALYLMLKKHVHIPFKMLCVTDNPEGICQEIKTIPLWEDFKDLGGCFLRLKCFGKDIGSILGERFVSIDLDCVITGDITKLFDRKEDFIIWGDTNRKTQYCGSLWMMDAGARSQVLENFDPALPKINKRGKYPKGTDQAQITKILWPHEKMWTKEDGIYNFVRDISRHRDNKKLPTKAKIVFFNGKVLPDDPVIQKDYPWVREHYPVTGDGDNFFLKDKDIINIIFFWWGN